VAGKSILNPMLHIAHIVALTLVGATILGVNYAVENVLPCSPIYPHRVTRTEMTKLTPRSSIIRGRAATSADKVPLA
jgi:hypothetical protein